MNKITKLKNKLISKVELITYKLAGIGIVRKIKKYMKLSANDFSAVTATYRDYIEICNLAVDYNGISRWGDIS